MTKWVAGAICVAVAVGVTAKYQLEFVPATIFAYFLAGVCLAVVRIIDGPGPGGRQRGSESGGEVSQES